jgi:superfamily II DNA/RNA helicase
MTLLKLLNWDPKITKAIQDSGYKTPTPIQLQSIPVIAEGKDLVATAETGSGKTASYMFPALQHLALKKSAGKARILVLAPTRELAAQITSSANKYGKYLQLNVVNLVGGMSYRQQLKALSSRVDIIVATPGRLLDHLENHRLDLSGIEILILDEADRMLDMGFIDDVKKIVKTTSKHRQTLLFSATVDSTLNDVIKSILKSPVHINLSNEKMAPSQIKQELYIVDDSQHKIKLLEHFLDANIYKAIIFSSTKINADRVARRLRDNGYAAAALHGDLKQNVRNRTLAGLRSGKTQFLVATDVAARGIDINDITHVFNYDLPRFPEDYVHRIGRTGRIGKEGVAISFALPDDAKHIQRIEKYIGAKLPRLTVEGLEPKKSHSEREQTSKPKRKGKSRRGFFRGGKANPKQGGGKPRKKS